jgi:hypothetical protein
MTSRGIAGLRRKRKLVKTPYLDTYKEMSEYDLTASKEVLEWSLAMKPSREKLFRLRAIEQTLMSRKSRAA